MTYTRIEKNEDGYYSFYFNDNFYNLFQPHYSGGSYHNVLWRLFGLAPQDFYHYLGAHYNANFKPSSIISFHIYPLFTTKEDAIAFTNEVDKRITYCVNRGDFK